VSILPISVPRGIDLTLRPGTPAGPVRSGERPRWWLVVPLLAVAAGSARSGSAQVPRRFVLDSAATRIWFDAGARLGDFRGEAARFNGWLDLRDTTAFSQARAGINIQPGSFHTGNGQRDADLRSTLDTRRFQWISFGLIGVVAHPDTAFPAVLRADTTRADWRDVVLRGTLTIRGQARDIDIPTRVALAGDTLLARGRVLIRFTQFGMKPPSKLLGILTVDDQLTLAFDAVFLAERP